MRCRNTCSTRRFSFYLQWVLCRQGMRFLKPRTQDRKARRTTVGDARVGDRLWIVAEHGMKAGYVRNLVRHSRVRVKLRKGFGARWHTGTAHVLSDNDSRERPRWLAGQVTSSIANSVALRLFGTELLTVRIDLDG
jgi:hypothetical protein